MTDHKYQFSVLKITVFLADIGYLVKLLSNHWKILIPEILENIGNFESWGHLTQAALKYKCNQHEKLQQNL